MNGLNKLMGSTPMGRSESKVRHLRYATFVSATFGTGIFVALNVPMATMTMTLVSDALPEVEGASTEPARSSSSSPFL